MSHDAFSYATVPNNTHPTWYKDTGLRSCMLRIFILYSAVYSLGFDGSLLNGLQALSPWQRDFGHPKGTHLGLIAASYYLPKIPLSFVIPFICDRFGRKVPLFIGAVFMFAGAAAGGAAQNRADLMGSRVLLGVGTAFAQIAAAALVPEIAHPRNRHHAGSFLNTTYFIGSIFAAWLTFSMVYYPNSSSSWAWRIPTLVQGLGPVILGIGVFFVPESPRWLVKKGRTEEAHAILARYHANGKMDDPLVLMELKEIEAAIATEKLTNQSSWAAFVNSSGGRRRLVVIFMLGTATQWLGNGLTSYYLVPVLKQVGITKSPQTAGINGGLAIWQWICALTGASLVEKTGRRPLFLTSLAGIVVCFTIMTGVSGGYAHTHHSATGLALIPFIFLFGAFYALAFTPLPMLVVPEISPLSMRAKSAALLLFSQNCAQAFNQFANPVALAAIAWKYFIVYVAVDVAYLVAFFFILRETRGLTVEESAVVYEPDDKRDAALAAERKIREAAALALKDSKFSPTDSADHIEKSSV